MNLDLELHEKHCIVCNKGIIAGPEWVFLVGSTHNKQYFCSWGCMRKFEKNRGTKAERRETIQRAISDGMTTEQIVNTYHVDRTNVIYWQKKMGVAV